MYYTICRMIGVIILICPILGMMQRTYTSYFETGSR